MAGQGGGSWKVAYADFVTAMMAFFLVMWILAQNKPLKKAIAEYFNDPWKTSLKPKGDCPGGASMVPGKDTGDPSGNAIRAGHSSGGDRTRPNPRLRGFATSNTVGLAREGPASHARRPPQPVFHSHRQQPLRGHAGPLQRKLRRAGRDRPGPAAAPGGGDSRAAQQGRDPRARHPPARRRRRPAARRLGAVLRPLPGHDEVPRATGDRPIADSPQPGRPLRALFAGHRRRRSGPTTPASRSTCSASMPRTSWARPKNAPAGWPRREYHPLSLRERARVRAFLLFARRRGAGGEGARPPGCTPPACK